MRRPVPGTGARRVRLTLEQPVETSNAIGGAAITFQSVITLWASIESTRGREREFAARAEGVTDTQITLRWRSGVDTRMRFSLGSRIFAIRAAFDRDGSRRNLVCLCEEITR